LTQAICFFENSTFRCQQEFPRYSFRRRGVYYMCSLSWLLVFINHDVKGRQRNGKVSTCHMDFEIIEQDSRIFFD